MTHLLCFILGLVVSDWLTAKVARFAVKTASGKARENVRNFARSRGIDLEEKGRVVRTSAYDARDAFNGSEDVLEALDKMPHEPAE